MSSSMQNTNKKVHMVWKINLTLTRNSENSALNKANVTNKAKNQINGIGWYVPHYTPSVEQ